MSGMFPVDCVSVRMKLGWQAGDVLPSGADMLTLGCSCGWRPCGAVIFLPLPVRASGCLFPVSAPGLCAGASDASGVQSRV